jgi:hypothetical protein
VIDRALGDEGELVEAGALGCGTYGGTSTCDNVSFAHLRNVKRVVPPLDGQLGEIR